MKIGYNPQDKLPLSGVPQGMENDIIFDIPALAIYAKGVKFQANLPVVDPAHSPSDFSFTENVDERGWAPTGFYLNDEKFSTGVYAIKITCGSLLFSGIASVYVGEITTDDEIMLHMCGIPHQYEDGVQGRIYAKIAPSKAQNCGELYLATNVPQSNVTNLSITMRKII